MTKSILLVGPIPAHLGSKNYGGVAAHTWLHAKLLANKGYHVTLLATGSYMGRSFSRDGVNVVGLSGVSVSWFVKSVATSLFSSLKLRDFRMAALINRFLTKYKLRDVDLSQFKVVHCQSIHNQFHSVADLPGNCRKILTVHSYHDILNAGAGKTRSLLGKHRISKSWFDAVIHVSQTDQDKARELGLTDDKGFVVHNPVVSFDVGTTNKRQDVIFVGGLTSRKRPDLLLKAVAQFGRKCVFLGGGPLENQLRIDYSEVADFYGFVDHEEALGFMAKSRVLCVPSVSESFGLVYVEAALSGTAVVGYKPTIDEISIAAGLTAEEQQFFVGFSPDESDPQVLAEVLEGILETDSHFFNRVLSSIAQKLRDTFSGDAYVREITKIYGIS